MRSDFSNIVIVLLVQYNAKITENNHIEVILVSSYHFASDYPFLCRACGCRRHVLFAFLAGPLLVSYLRPTCFLSAPYLFPFLSFLTLVVFVFLTLYLRSYVNLPLYDTY